MKTKPKPTKSPFRPITTIQQEYSQLCGQAGDIAFRIWCAEAELTAIKGKLLQLNKEGQETQAHEVLLKSKTGAEKNSEPTKTQPEATA